MPNELWFRGMEFDEEEKAKKQNAKESKGIECQKVGHRRLRVRSTNNCADTRSPGNRIEFGGRRRREVSRAHRQVVPDDIRGIL